MDMNLEKNLNGLSMIFQHLINSKQSKLAWELPLVVQVSTIKTVFQRQSYTNKGSSNRLNFYLHIYFKTSAISIIVCLISGKIVASIIMTKPTARAHTNGGILAKLLRLIVLPNGSQPPLNYIRTYTVQLYFQYRQVFLHCVLQLTNIR